MIRKARTEDAARVGAIAHAAYAKYVPRIGREPAPMATDYAAEIAAGHVLVVEAAGAVVGYIITSSGPNSYVIENVAVAPAHQGQGYGRRLVDSALARARDAGFPIIRLYTNAAMTENVALYRHLGFVEVERATTDGYDRIYMELNL